MFYFLPVSHSESRLRRWPLATFILIAFNVIVFAATTFLIDDEQIELDALHGQMQALKCKVFVHLKGNEYHVDLWKRESCDLLWREYRHSINATWKLFTLGGALEESDPLSQEYAKLKTQIEEYERGTILSRFGLTPNKYNPLKALSCMFLHGGIWHLLGNMFILYLIGPTLEDTLGILIYLALYALSGLVGNSLHALIFLSSSIPLIGASGAISGLMGAFLIRFFKAKIHFVYLLWLYWHVRAGKFSLPTWLVFGIWFGLNLLSSLLDDSSGHSGGVAFAAHVSGFVFGFLIMILLMALQREGQTLNEEEGIEEEKAFEDVKEKIEGVDIHEKVAKARNRIEMGQYEEARALFDDYDNPMLSRLIVAESYLAEGRLIDAQRLGRDLAADEMGKGNYALVAEMVRMFGKYNADPGVTAQSYLRLAAHFADVDNLEAAQDFIERLLARDPLSPLVPKALWQAARIDTKLGKQSRAAERWRQIVAKYPDHPLAADAQREIEKADLQNATIR